MKHFFPLIALVLFSCTKDPVMFDITISSNEGGTVSPKSGSFEEGSSVTFTATPIAEYEFSKWSNGSIQNPLMLTVTSNLTLQAIFTKKQYELIISKEGEGTVNEKIINTGKGYDSGTKVELTAVPAGEWVFAGWSGDVTSNDNPLQVTISSPKNIKAKFIKRKYPLTINIQGQGTVTEEIVNTGRTTEYDSGLTVRLTATPAIGWNFTSWEGDYNSTETSIQLIINEDKVINVNFSLAPFVSKSIQYDGINATVSSLRKSYYYPGFNMNFNLNNPDLDKLSDIPYVDLNGITYDPTMGSSAFVDFDSNGQLDFIVLMQSKYWNDPCGVKLRVIKNIFTEEKELFIYDTDYNTGLNTFQVNDFNGDGVDDIIIESSNYHYCGVENSHGDFIPVEIYYFNPDGTFTQSQITPPTQLHDFTSGDIDNDGDVDLLYITTRQEIDNPYQIDYWPYVYLNDGVGNFHEVNSFDYFFNLKTISDEYLIDNWNGLSGRIVVASSDLFDLNNDGVLDLILGNNYLHDIMVRNDWNNDNYPDNFPISAIVVWGLGEGKFDFKNITNLENNWMKKLNINQFLENENTNGDLSVLSASFTDYNHDGFYNVLLTGSPSYKGEYIHLLKNNGDKTFTDVTEQTFDEYYSYHGNVGGPNISGMGYPQVYDLILFDLDGDQDYDIIPSASGWGTGPHFNPNKPEFYYKKVGNKYLRTNKW